LRRRCRRDLAAVGAAHSGVTPAQTLACALLVEPEAATRRGIPKRHAGNPRSLHPSARAPRTGSLAGREDVLAATFAFGADTTRPTGIRYRAVGARVRAQGRPAVVRRL